MIFFFAKAVLLYNVTYIFFRNLIYKDTSNLLILFCFLPVINHLAISGLRVMGRTCQLFFPVILSIIVFCVIVGVFGIGSRAIWFQSSWMDVLLTAAKHIEPFGDAIFLFVVMDKINIKNGDWKVMFYLFAISAVLVVATALVFMLSYTYTSFMHPYAVFEIVSFVKEFGGLGRIDIIAMVVIIILAYFHLAIYLKCFMFAFEQVFPKIDKIYSVITFNFLFVVTVIFFIINLETAVTFGEQILPYAEIFPFFILPIFVLIALAIKNKNVQKKPENGGNLQKILKNNERKELNNSQNKSILQNLNIASHLQNVNIPSHNLNYQQQKQKILKKQQKQVKLLKLNKKQKILNSKNNILGNKNNISNEEKNNLKSKNTQKSGFFCNKFQFIAEKEGA